MDQSHQTERIDPDASAEEARPYAILEAIGYAATRIVLATDWRSGIQALLGRLRRGHGAMRAGGGIAAIRTHNAAVLFADLVNYTEMSASMSGERILVFLREFHGLVEDAVFGNEGTLDKYMGDGLMATFGTPVPGARDASNAVACARHLVSAIHRWNERREPIGLPRIQVSVGLHFGEVTLGDAGSDRRIEFTAVGHTVNLASRIEAASRMLQTEIVASDAIVAAVRQEGGAALLAGFRNLGRYAIRGAKHPVELWGLAARSLARSAGAKSPSSSSKGVVGAM
jgi:class 3 adenylate cyclase